MTELGKILKKFAEDRRDLMEDAKRCAREKWRDPNWRRDFPGARPLKWHFVGRGIEMIAIDDTGERNDYIGGPDYLEVKELTHKVLKDAAKHWMRREPPAGEPKLAKIGLAYGLDVYDTFADYMAAMRGDWLDHDIWGDWAEAEIPIGLLMDRDKDAKDALVRAEERAVDARKE